MYGVVIWLVFQVVQGYSALGGSKYGYMILLSGPINKVCICICICILFYLREVVWETFNILMDLCGGGRGDFLIY